jgi:hypothetical protein
MRASCRPNSIPVTWRVTEPRTYGRRRPLVGSNQRSLIILDGVTSRNGPLKGGLCRRLSHGVTIPSNLVNCPHTCLSVSFVNSRAED